LERGAPLGLGVFQVVNRGEMAVGQHGVSQWPEMLSRLQFGRVRRQEEQMDVLRHAQMDAGVPACAVENEDDLFGGTGAHLAGKRRQFDFEEWDADGRGQVEDAPTRSRMHETDEVAPRIAVLDGRTGTLAVKTPDFVEDGLEANAVFVGRPELDLRLGEGSGHRLEQRPHLFLKASC
jgi:hypothetical protein